MSTTSADAATTPRSITAASRRRGEERRGEERRGEVLATSQWLGNER
jgi:hypothetical protein